LRFCNLEGPMPLMASFDLELLEILSSPFGRRKEQLVCFWSAYGHLLLVKDAFTYDPLVFD
jgi:hypothetical protein